MSRAGVYELLDDIGPMTSKELALLHGTAVGTADRALRGLRKLKQVHITGWDRPAKGRPAAIYALGDGEDARRPGSMPRQKKRARQTAREKMLRQRQQAGV